MKNSDTGSEYMDSFEKKFREISLDTNMEELCHMYNFDIWSSASGKW